MNGSTLYITNILLSAGLVLMAFLFRKYKPQKRNHIYGYRTRRSMKSHSAWLLANRYSSDLMFRLAIGISIIHLGVLIFWNGRYAILVLSVLWMVMPLIVIFRTERLLRRKSGNGQELTEDDETFG